MTGRIDSRVWLLWALSASVLVMLGRNPLYLLILLLLTRVVDALRGAPERGLSLPLLPLGLVVILFSTLFNFLFVHVGTTVLVRLPSAWPLIGGPLTLEAAVYGVANGLMLLTLLSIFLTFNRVVAVGDLARLAPRAFYDVGVVILVAITYVPETSRHLQQIREAQAIRGHEVRGITDWRPLLIPLVVGGLERALNLAEAMVARGYGARPAGAPPAWLRVAMLAILLLGLLGWALVIWWGWAGWLLLGAAFGAMALLLWYAGRGVRYTRYRARPWTLTDSLAAVTVLLPLLAAPFLGSASLGYSPYPALELPPFQPVFGLLLILLIVPAVLDD